MKVYIQTKNGTLYSTNKANYDKFFMNPTPNSCVMLDMLTKENKVIGKQLIRIDNIERVYTINVKEDIEIKK